MTRLMTDVFVGRMSGPTLATDQIDALMTWIDAQPRVRRAAPADPAAVERGRALFNDSDARGLRVCHSGARFTNNATSTSARAARSRCPSLVGIGSRGPFMHDGCAKTLRDRFTTRPAAAPSTARSAVFSANELSDLVTYLQSI